jgi:hypothetical protein
MGLSLAATLTAVGFSDGDGRQSLVFVEFDVEYFPFSTGYTGMTALVILVAILTSDIIESAQTVDTHLVDRSDA